jgi:hypothetical protein
MKIVLIILLLCLVLIVGLLSWALCWAAARADAALSTDGAEQRPCALALRPDDTCEFGPYGPHGERMCMHCGAGEQAAGGGPERDA